MEIYQYNYVQCRWALPWPKIQYIRKPFKFIIITKFYCPPPHIYLISLTSKCRYNDSYWMTKILHYIYTFSVSIAMETALWNIVRNISSLRSTEYKVRWQINLLTRHLGSYPGRLIVSRCILLPKREINLWSVAYKTRRINWI